MAAVFRPKVIDYTEQYKAKLKINLWDTAGQEKFQSLTKQYIQGSNGIILVYDLTDRDSLSAAEDWYNQVSNQVDIKSLVVTLVGNKSDDIERQEVGKKESENLAKRLGADLSFVVSAKTGQNMEN